MLGRQLREQGDTLAFEVVGVTGDVRFEKVAETPEPMAYYAIAPTGEILEQTGLNEDAVLRVFLFSHEDPPRNTRNTRKGREAKGMLRSRGRV